MDVLLKIRKELKMKNNDVKNSHFTLIKNTDLFFAKFLGVQWLVAIFLAFYVSPKTWAGEYSTTHIHVYAAIFLGGLLSLYPIYRIWKNPGETSNRYIAAVSQALFSSLFIHLTGGRIETHFHIFVSFAFLAFYLDWKILILPTIVTSFDHIVRGLFFPESIYGVVFSPPWRSLEHIGWVVFEDVVLFYLINNGAQMLRNLVQKQTELEDALNNVEEKVKKRTQELLDSKQTIVNQQQKLVASSKMSALGEMAGGIAHEINNPLAVINIFTNQLSDELDEAVVNKDESRHLIEQIDKTVDRIAKIIKGLRSFARDGSNDPKVKVSVKKLVEETLTFCGEKFKKNFVKINLGEIDPTLSLKGREIELSQVLLNLLNNAFDAISELPEKWISIDVSQEGNKVKISVTDSGSGIPKHIQEQIFEPFFTTKDVGKGTGMGLSISAGIIKSHDGVLSIDPESKNTRFIIELEKENV